MSEAADWHIGAFTDHGPWTLPDRPLVWQNDIDDRRARARAGVARMTTRRRLPPRRGATVAAQLVRAIVPWAARNYRRRDDLAARAELAAGVRRTFERLGPTFIKLGQLVASAEGMLPAGWVAEFKLCRDRVPAEPFVHVRSVIEADFGRPLSSIFAAFNPVPVAAASIAQVHAATLHTGEEVVVKVQRPDIAKLVMEDIATIAWVAPLLERLAPQTKIVNVPAYLELFAETIVEELDFTLEAQNMLDVARILARTDERAVVVPRPHPDLVSRRVLVMERLHGMSIDDERALADAGVDPTPVFRALMVSFLEGAMIYGVFHGDLHGGNMLVTADGRPALFDFGITGRFVDNRRQALLGLLMASAAQDGRMVLQFFRDLGGLPPDADIEKVAVDIGIDELMTQDPSSLSPEAMALQMREATNRIVAHGGRLPKELFLYMKCIVYLTGAIALVAADVDMFGEMEHLYRTFTTAHAQTLAQAGVDIPDMDVTMERMRKQFGVDGDELSFAEVMRINGERAKELRAVRRKSAWK